MNDADKGKWWAPMAQSLTECDPIALDNTHADWARLSIAGTLLASPVLAQIQAEAERKGAARVVAAVEGLHFRRHWSFPGDSVTFGQAEFPDQCDHCRRAWPCETATALSADRAESEGAAR